MSNYCVASFGEVLIDFVSKSGAYHPFTGGAPANVAVAVSKLGGESFFIGAVGDDFFGSMITEELRTHGCNIDHVETIMDIPTSAAYVSIDQLGERSFSFSRHDTADMHYPIDKIPYKLFESRQGIFHLGSNSLTTEKQTALSLSLLGLAKSYGWSISFDVNLRANLWPNSTINIHRIKQVLRLADYVKVSDDELSTLLPELVNATPNTDQIYTPLKLKSETTLVLTSGPGLIKLYCNNKTIEYQPIKVNAIDTTGAGDAFFGGFLYFISQYDIDHLNLSDYKEAIIFAAKCGAYSVQYNGAIASYPSHADLEKSL